MEGNDEDYDGNRNRILFASCSSQQHEQVLWPAVRSRRADAFVWAGDAIYADAFGVSYVGKDDDDDNDEESSKSAIENRRWWLPISIPYIKAVEATPEVFPDMYDKQLKEPGYRALLEDGVKILGTIDDHDYGINNGDIRYRYKRESAMAFVNFLSGRAGGTGGSSSDDSSSSSSSSALKLMEQRAAAGHGVYGVKVFDFGRGRGEEIMLSDEEAGLDPDAEYDRGEMTSSSSSSSLSDKSVAVFLLDVRSNKTPWKKRGLERFKLDYGGDFLGERQWDWFQKALDNSTASVNVIVQGLQVHADRFFDGNVVESWSRFPASQHRLYQTVLNSNASAPILVSGDVHLAELLRKDCARKGDHRDGGDTNRMDDRRPLLEVTTSGMTHSWGTKICSRKNLFPTCRIPYVDWSLSAGMDMAHRIGFWNDIININGADAGNRPDAGGHVHFEEEGVPGEQYALALNFAEFEFDWDNRQVAIRVLGREVNGAPLLSMRWDFDALSGKQRHHHDVVPGPIKSTDYDEMRSELIAHGSARQDDWICLPYRGPQTATNKAFAALTGLIVIASLLLLPFVVPALLALVIMRTNRRKREATPATS